MKKGLLFSISILGTLAVWAQPRTGLKVDSVMVVNTYKPNLLDATKMTSCCVSSISFENHSTPFLSR